MKTVLIVIGAIVLAVIIAGGSFYGGMAYQRNQEAAEPAFSLRAGVGMEGSSFRVDKAERQAPMVGRGRVALAAALPGR
jgi:hypothetical protein